MKYGLISDTHYHDWTQFASVGSDHVNSRLQQQIDETLRAARVLNEMGIKHLFHAGDCFHVRGKIAPSVLNPVLDAYRYIVNELGIEVHMIPGNHDLETNDSHRITNASSALAGVGVEIITEPTEIQGFDRNILMIPWMSSTDNLLTTMREIKAKTSEPHKMDVIIHAPVNGVIMGIPDNGLNAHDLGGVGFRHVFAGHYHNHKSLGDGVYSIGAATHQTWSDVDSLAGFVIVDGDSITHVPSEAPSFVDLQVWESVDSAEEAVKGNYIRAKIEIESESEVIEMREFLTELGAAGVTVHPIRKPKNAARQSTVNTSVTLQQSITEYVEQSEFKDKAAVNVIATEILQEVDNNGI